MKISQLFSIMILFIVSNLSLGQAPEPNVNSPYFSIEHVGSMYSKDVLYVVFNQLDYCGMLNPNLSYPIALDDSSLVRIHAASDIKNPQIDSPCIRNNDITEQAKWLIKEGILIKMVKAKHTK